MTENDSRGRSPAIDFRPRYLKMLAVHESFALLREFIFAAEPSPAPRLKYFIEKVPSPFTVSPFDNDRHSVISSSCLALSGVPSINVIP